MEGEALPSALDWARVGRLATGCASEYLKASSSKLLFCAKSTSGGEQQQAVDDHVEALEAGMPVLYYVDGLGLEQRILKVDSRFTFCYIMSPFLAGMEKSLSPVLMPIQQARIHTDADALALCQKLGLADDINITQSSTVIVETGDRQDGEDILDRSTIYVFVAPPRAKLKDRIMACKTSLNRRAMDSQQKTDGNPSGENQVLLDGVRLEDPLAVYGEARHVELQVLYFNRGGLVGGRQISCTLKMPLHMKKIPEEIAKIESKGYLLIPVDKARMRYIMREVALIYMWANNFRKLFQEDFHSFVSRAQNDDDDTSRLCFSATIAHVCQIPSVPDGDAYGQVALKSVFAALRQMQELDGKIVVARNQERERVKGRLAASKTPVHVSLPEPDSNRTSQPLSSRTSGASTPRKSPATPEDTAEVATADTKGVTSQADRGCGLRTGAPFWFSARDCSWP